MRRADLADVDAELGKAADEGAGGAGVVEMDVGEQQALRLPLEGLEQGLEAGGRPRIDQRLAEVPAADRAIDAEVTAVDQPGAGEPANAAPVGP